MKSFRTEKELELYYQKKSQKYKKKLSLLENNMIGGGLASPFKDFSSLNDFYTEIIEIFGVSSWSSPNKHEFLHSLVPHPEIQKSHSFVLLTKPKPEKNIPYIYVSGYAYRAFVKMVYVCGQLSPPTIGSTKLSEQAVTCCKEFRKAVLHEKRFVEELLGYQTQVNSGADSNKKVSGNVETGTDTKPKATPNPMIDIQGFYYIHLLNQILNKQEHQTFINELEKVQRLKSDSTSFQILETLFTQYFGPATSGANVFTTALYNTNSVRTGCLRPGETSNAFRKFRQYKGITTQQALIRLRDLKKSLMTLQTSHLKEENNVGPDNLFTQANLSNDKTNLSGRFKLISKNKIELQLQSLQDKQVGRNSFTTSTQGDVYFQLDLLGTTGFDEETLSQSNPMTLTTPILKDGSKEGNQWDTNAKTAIPNRTITTPLLFDLFQTNPVYFKENDFLTDTIDKDVYDIYKENVLDKLIEKVNKELTYQFYEDKNENFPCMDTFRASGEQSVEKLKAAAVQHYLDVANKTGSGGGVLEGKPAFKWLEPNITFPGSKEATSLISTQQFYRKHYGDGDGAILVYQSPEKQGQEDSPRCAIFQVEPDKTLVMDGDKQLLSRENTSSKLLETTFHLKNKLVSKKISKFMELVDKINNLSTHNDTQSKQKIEQIASKIKCAQPGEECGSGE